VCNKFVITALIFTIRFIAPSAFCLALFYAVRKISNMTPFIAWQNVAPSRSYCTAIVFGVAAVGALCPLIDIISFGKAC